LLAIDAAEEQAVAQAGASGGERNRGDATLRPAGQGTEAGIRKKLRQGKGYRKFTGTYFR